MNDPEAYVMTMSYKKHKKMRLPRFGQWLLKRMVDKDIQYSALGDFDEIYLDMAKTSPIRAIVWYWAQILKSIPSFIIDTFQSKCRLYSNYFTVCIRNIWRYKGYAFISIFSLAVGMTCSLYIMLFIQNELSYDKYHEKSDRIFRIVSTFHGPGGIDKHFATSSAPYAPTLQSEYNEVEGSVRIFPKRSLVEIEKIKFYEDNLFYVDASIFTIFSFPLTKGNPESSLNKPNTVVLSENTARKYFGNNDPMNRTVQIEEIDFLITGVMENIPSNSHFIANIFVSFKTLEQDIVFQKEHLHTWERHETYSYILLSEGSHQKKLEEKLPSFIKKHAEKDFKRNLGGTVSYNLQPLKDIHLKSEKLYDIRPNYDFHNIYLFSAIAYFILIIACINFMNLSTARSVKRAKEVGIRKVLGATRTQLIVQFLDESLIFTIIASFVTLILIEFTIPIFNAITGKTFTSNLLFNWD